MNRETVPTLQQCDLIASTDKEKADMLNKFLSLLVAGTLMNYHQLRMLMVLMICMKIQQLPLTKSFIHSILLTLIKPMGQILVIYLHKYRRQQLTAFQCLWLDCLLFLYQTAGFQKMWKIAGVVPIPKCSSKHNPSNYRPMSLLSVVSKLLERIVHSLLC